MHKVFIPTNHNNAYYFMNIKSLRFFPMLLAPQLPRYYFTIDYFLKK